MIRRRLFQLLLALMVLSVATEAASEPASLARARELYNAADFDGAIAAASESQRQAEWADASTLVIARSRLERFRLRAEAADLVEGRQALEAVHLERLSPRDQVDFYVGLGQCLFLADDFGPATELFENALAQSFLLTTRERLGLLDWWANALDRSASGRPAAMRPALFERLSTRMDEELFRDPGNPVANYWIPVAARGLGDVERAWDAAVAGWVRARLTPDATESIRTDLDRFVQQVLIPERVRARAAPGPVDALQQLRDDWERVKQQWR